MVFINLSELNEVLSVLKITDISTFRKSSKSLVGRINYDKINNKENFDAVNTFRNSYLRDKLKS